MVIVIRKVSFITLLFFVNYSFSQEKDTIYLSFNSNPLNKEGFISQKSDCSKNTYKYVYSFRTYRNYPYKNKEEEIIMIGNLMGKKKLNFLYKKRKRKNKKELFNFLSNVMSDNNFRNVTMDSIISKDEILKLKNDEVHNIIYEYLESNNNLAPNLPNGSRVILSQSFKNRYYNYFKKYNRKKILKDDISIIDMDKQINDYNDYLKLYDLINNAETIFVVDKKSFGKRKMLAQEVFFKPQGKKGIHKI